MFISSVVSLVTTAVAPFLVVSGESRVEVVGEKQSGGLGKWVEGKLERVPKTHLARIWAVSHALFAACMLATVYVLALLLRAYRS
jgi:solute carrier family 45 protein 1/2/4